MSNFYQPERMPGNRPTLTKLWNVLMPSRLDLHYFVVTQRKRFCKLELESYRNALRFHRISNLDLNEIQVNRFTLLIFGLTKLPFTLECKLKVHINNYKSVYPEVIENIRNDMHVDDLVQREIS